MDSRTLIDSIVRQTTVLIAQLSTAAGIRAPVAHVADQVFCELARELEAQGVRQKVAADMFGMALRTYQKRMQRLTAARGEQGRTLWESVVTFLDRRTRTTRAEVRQRFRHDEERDVAAVLRDLVDSGLCDSKGSGDGATYTMTSSLDRAALSQQATPEAIQDFVWLAIFRQGPLTTDDLAAAVPRKAEALDAALRALVKHGRVTHDGSSDTYRSSEFVVPVGSTGGWEAAVFDHFQTVVVAIAEKVGRLGPRSRADDTIGGATYAFDLSASHPLRNEVFELLSRTRTELDILWDRVEAHNQERPIAPEDLQRASFYFGLLAPGGLASEEGEN